MAGTSTLSNALDTNEINSLSPSIKQKLEVALGSAVTEIESLKSKYEKFRVNSEQQFFELEKQLISTSGLLETEKTSMTETQTKLAEMEKQLKETRVKLQEQEKKIDTIESQKMELTNANQLLEAEKTDLNSFLEKRDKDMQRLKEDLKEVSDKLSTTNKQKCDAQAEVMKIEANNVSRQYREKRLEQERDQLQKQVDWLNSQLSEKTKEVVTFKRDKAAKMLELQASLDEKTEEVSHLTAMIEALKSSKEELGTKIEGLAQKLKEARDMQTTAEEQYRQELSAQTRLVNLYKTSTQENSDKVAELIRAVEELQKLLKEANSAYSQLETSKAEEVGKLHDALKERELKIESLETELRNANDLLGAKKSNFTVSQEEVEAMFPRAAFTSRLLKSGMSLTQIYSEYVKVTDSLEAQKEDNRRLNSFLDQILQEIEDVSPRMIRQRDEYSTTLMTLEQLTPKLDTSLLECEKLRNDNEELKRRTNYFQRENTRIQQRNIDLSRQVKFLLKEIQELKGGCVVADDEREVSSSQDSSSSRIISEKLVTFRNITELQEKNQQLLETLRDLSRQREEEEILASDTRVTELKQQLQEAGQELERLRCDRKRQTEMVEAIVRQRDMYRVLLQQGGGATPVSPSQPLTSTPMPASQSQDLGTQRHTVAELEKSLTDAQMAIKEIQAEYNTYRKEKLENERILNEQLEKVRNQLSESRMQNARICSQVDHSAERYKILQSNAESYRKEIAALQDKCQKYATSVAKHEMAISKLKEEVFEKQKLASTWEAKVDQQKAQYDTLRSNEQRLVAELESMHRERQSQAVLNANLQAIQNNLERAEFESKTRYTNQIDSMEKELALLKRKLQCIEEERATTVSALQTKVKSLEAELSKAREAQEQLKTQADSAREELQANQQELSEVVAKLAAAENKLTSLGTSEEGMPAEEEVKELKNEVKQLKLHLNSVQGQLKTTKQQVDQFRTMAEEAENNLQQFNQTSKDVQESCLQKMIEAQNAKAALEKRMEQLEKDHQELLSENIRITEDSHNLNNDLRKQLASLRHELQEAIQARETAVTEQLSAQNNLQKQVDLAAEAQDKYQRELMLHAADVEALTALKKQMESHNDDLASARSEIDAEKQKLLNAQTAWQEQERVLREERRQLEVRCEELEKQNSTLHSQMEKLSNQAIAMQQKAADDPHNLSLSEEASKSSEQLLEVIKFLRREKEIAETKLEVADFSTVRLQQKLTLLENQLEETKQALTEERQQNQTSVQTMSQHMELMRKVETVNLLQESNKLLREESTRLQALQQELEAKVHRLEEEISPLQAAVREATAQKEVLEAEKRTLTAEVDRWKSRTHHLVEQSNKTDPEEHRKLMQEKDQIRKQLAQKTEELFRIKAELSRVNVVVTSKEADINNQREEMNKKIEELQETKRLLDEEQKEGEKKNTTINQLKKIGRKYKEQSEAIQKELDQLKAASAGQQTQQSSAAAAAEQANKSLTDRLAAAEKERDEIRGRVSQKDAEVASLKDQISAIQQDLNQKQELLLKQQEEASLLQSDNARLQSESTELEKKQLQSRNVLHSARIKITQQKEAIDRLSAENAEMKNRAGASAGANTTQVSREDSDQLVASVRSQYEQQVTQLRQQLEEARRGSGSPSDQDKLAAENAELQNKVQQLQRQVEVMTKATSAQPTQPMSRQATNTGTSPTSTETPKMASIKPVATAAAAPAMQSSQAKATASIRPMAIASANTASTSGSLPPYPSSSSTPPIVTVMPTTVMQAEPSTDEQPSTSSVQQQTSIPAASVTGRPQQQVQIVTPQMESSVEPSISSSVEEATQAIVAPSIQEPVHGVPPSQQPSLGQGVTSALAVPAPSTSGDQPPVQLGKRGRDDLDLQDETDPKRSKMAPTQEVAVIPTITVLDENSKVVTQIEPQQDMEPDAASIDTTEQIEGTEGLETEPQEDRGQEGDIIVVNSDEEGQGAGQERDEGQQAEGDVQDTEEEVKVIQASEEIEEEDFEEDEEVQEAELEEEGMPGEGAEEEEEDDNDVVIIDMDEADTPAVSTQEEAAASSLQSTASPRPPPPPLQTMPAHAERLPSTSRQLTPFLLGQGGVFEDDDCMVPSTPTLSMPRRNDGFAEALNSPHVAQRFVFGADGASQPELAQLESQRALGMDDTRMDLSQFDEGGARSIPTTPVPQQVAAPVSLESVSAGGASTAASVAPSVPSTVVTTAVSAAAAHPSSSTHHVTSTAEGSEGQGEGQTQPETTRAVEEQSGEAIEGQDEEQTEAALLEGEGGEEEDADDLRNINRPRIQRIVWNAPGQLPPIAGQPAPSPSQPQTGQRGARARGLRQGAMPTRPARGAYSWRGGMQQQPQHQRGMGAMRRGGNRGGYRGGQF